MEPLPNPDLVTSVLASCLGSLILPGTGSVGRTQLLFGCVLGSRQRQVLSYGLALASSAKGPEMRRQLVSFREGLEGFLLSFAKAGDEQ